eukprot:2861005-Amphidinium_carterae.1
MASSSCWISGIAGKPWHSYATSAWSRCSDTSNGMETMSRKDTYTPKTNPEIEYRLVTTSQFLRTRTGEKGVTQHNLCVVTTGCMLFGIRAAQPV